MGARSSRLGEAVESVVVPNNIADRLLDILIEGQFSRTDKTSKARALCRVRSNGLIEVGADAHVVTAARRKARGRIFLKIVWMD